MRSGLGPRTGASPGDPGPEFIREPLFCHLPVHNVESGASRIPQPSVRKPGWRSIGEENTVLHAKTRLVPAGIALGALVAGLATFGGPAGAVVQDPLPITPHQAFIGLVNGKTSDAVIAVACPIGSVTGRALSGQTLEVVQPEVVRTTTGNTGAKGRRIVATVLPTPSAVAGVTFSGFYIKEDFPTTVPVPCSGVGVIRFAPLPTSKSAVPFDISVTWGNVTVSG